MKVTFWLSCLLFALLADLALAQLDQENLVIYSYGGTRWESIKQTIAVDSWKIGLLKTICRGNGQQLLSPDIATLGESDLAGNKLKKAGLSFKWSARQLGQEQEIFLGKHLGAITHFTPSPAKEAVLANSPIYLIYPEIYQTGVHLNLKRQNRSVHLGYYGKDAWSLAASQKINLLSVALGLAQLDGRQLFGQLLWQVCSNWKSDLTVITANKQNWLNYQLDNLAGHWRVIVQPTNNWELYQQMEWLGQKFSGISLGANLVLAEESRLMLCYTTGQTDRWLARATWYFKQQL